MLGVDFLSCFAEHQRAGLADSLKGEGIKVAFIVNGTQIDARVVSELTRDALVASVAPPREKRAEEEGGGRVSSGAGVSAGRR